MLKMKNIIEAVLFISARPMSITEIASASGIRPKSKIKEVLDEMKKDYDHHGIYIEENEGLYELKVKREHTDIVSLLAPEQDFQKAVLQTLAIIAYKNPIKQSNIIEIRGNRAYDHLAELESKGFITRVPLGHTNVIKITRKFLEYFGLQSKDDLEKYFKGVNIPVENISAEAAEKKIEDKEIKKEPDPETEKRRYEDRLRAEVEKRKHDLQKEKESKAKTPEQNVQPQSAEDKGDEAKSEAKKEDKKDSKHDA